MCHHRWKMSGRDRRGAPSASSSRSELGRNLDSDIGGLHHRIRHHAGGQLEFVSRLASDEGHKSMGSGLDLNLSGYFVLHHPGDNPEEAVAGRLPSGMGRSVVAGDLDCELSQIRTLDMTAATHSNRRLDPPGVHPSPHGVRAHPQQLGCLTDAVLHHTQRVTRNKLSRA